MGSLFTTDPGVCMAHPLTDSRYRPRFSGHETFAMRYGWLKKAFDAVKERGGRVNSNEVFLGDGAIAEFGVGKNMVASIRHWANATRIIEDAPSHVINTTRLGELLFDQQQGLDPYMENPSTIWLMHWQLVSDTPKTTWHWAFNYYPRLDFEAKSLFHGLQELSQKQGWTPSPSTLEKDITCFISTYAPQRAKSQSAPEDRLLSPLIELRLVRPLGDRNAFRFMRGSKPSLGDGVFTYALLDFWHRSSPDTSTLSFEAIAHGPGGPGRVFLLDENSLADRLAGLETFTDGQLRWSETAGLKQVERQPELDFKNRLGWVRRDYRARSGLVRKLQKARKVA